MSSARYVLLPLVVTQLVYATDDATDDATNNTLFNVIMQHCWGAMRHASSPVGVSEQRAIHDMIMMDSSCFGHEDQPHGCKINGVALYDAAYVALGCKWAGTVAGALKSLKAVRGSRSAIRESLAELNRITLKTESALFRLAKLEPNVLTREPGALAAVLSLNLRLNRAVATAYSADVASCSKTTYRINAAINTIESFTIGNCAMAVQPYPVMDQSEKSPNLVAKLDDVLDSTGLSEPDYGQYNVNDRASSVTDPKRLSVVHSVASSFCSLLDLPVDEDLTFAYVDDVFRHQRQMYDRIRWVVHSQTLVYLVDLQKSINSSESDTPGNKYLGQTYIEQNGLVLCYEKLLDTANSLSFPPDMVDHVELMLLFVKNIIELKTVKNLDFYIAYEKHNITFFSANKSDVTNSSRVLKNYTSSESKHFELHTFLNDILSVEFVMYYNNIFKLSKYGFQEVQYRDPEIDGNTLLYFAPIYEHCFNVKSANERNTIDPDTLNAKFMNVLNDLETLKNYISNTHETVNLTILIEADQYLSYNIILYSISDENVQDKLNRTIYMFTNLIDRHQMIFFKQYTLRDDAFVTYASKFNNQQKEDLKTQSLKFPFQNKVKNNSLLINTNGKLTHCVLFRDIYNVKLDIRSSVDLFWKGKLKSINDILNDVTTNLFDIYSIPKYVKVFIEWVTAVISYTLLDSIKYILDGYAIPYVHRYIEEWNSYKWPKYCLIALKTTINIMSKKFISQNTLVELQSILKNNLHQYSNKVQRNVNYQVPILSSETFVNSMEQLNNLLKTVFCLDNELINKCKTESSKNPLVFYFPEYFVNV